jgi:serine/tyrosine/threonine adenylyltransferase
MSDNKNSPVFAFDNSFYRCLEDFFISCQAEPSASPKLLHFNYALAKELGLNASLLTSEEGLSILSGNQAPGGATPIALAYSGHQFGGFSPLLGDGRALLLGEIIDMDSNRYDIQLKGSGRTPFSRSGDGKSALGPVLREYLIAEFMHAVGIPTTRALAAVSTGDMVYRATPLPGGILTRVAASHIRIGTFQYGATLADTDKMRKLTDYSMARHYPEVFSDKSPYLSFFKAAIEAQAFLVAKWMSVGFIHGVMNTDNIAISGETIDYGPCAFMDDYAPGTVFSSIDTQGRYAYANQPLILSWNLSRLAETLIPLVDSDQDRAISLLTEAINTIAPTYERYWLVEMRSKIGLANVGLHDLELINDLLSIMEKQKVDFTLFFSGLSKALSDNSNSIRKLFIDPLTYDTWASRWRERLLTEGTPEDDVVKAMNKVNPSYIPRNHKVEEALSAAVDNQDLKPFSRLLAIVTKPFDETSGNESYAQAAPPSNSPYKTFCGT